MSEIRDDLTVEEREDEDNFKDWVNSISFVDKYNKVIEPKLVDDPDIDPDA
jgi:hypothetical protein